MSLNWKNWVAMEKVVVLLARDKWERSPGKDWIGKTQTVRG